MKTSSKNKKKAVSRKLPGGEHKHGLKKHTKLVGELLWAWNELHLAYAFTFAWAVNESRSWVGQAIWNSITNDSVQRGALEAVLAFLPKPGLSKHLRWALKETAKLARYRNDVVHGPMIWLLTEKGSKPTFDYFGNPTGRLLRYIDHESEDGEFIEGPNLDKLMLLVRGDLMQLAKYVEALGRSIVSENQISIPRKPKLRADKFVYALEKKVTDARKRVRRAALTATKGQRKSAPPK